MSKPAARTARVVHRSPRPPVPALPPLEALDQTHRQVLQVLNQIDARLRHIEASGVDDLARTQAATVAAFFNGHAREHHAAEEQHVFPGLLASGNAELVQAVQRLQQDHGWLEEDWLELAPQFEAIARGYNWYDLEGLRHSLPVFTALYHEHIALEESLIYPEARRQRDAHAAGHTARAGTAH